MALVLQGGGALGSYQAGVYEALSTSQYLPDWVAGISIGAINAAIIAGNAPEQRVERLQAFWEGITAPHAFFWQGGPETGLLPAGWGGALADRRRLSSLAALLFGQPGFFAPRPPTDWIFGAPPTSFYDTSALKSTLERLVDFDRINAREIRFSVGAVNVRTGNFAYFDNATITIRPEHVMASGALPPGFPAVEIDGEYYWDGGLVSNTPLKYVLEYIPRRSRLTFQVDLFPAARSAARRPGGGGRARQGHPLFQPHPRRHHDPQEDARFAARHQHAVGGLAGGAARAADGPAAVCVRLRHHDGHRPACLSSRRRSGSHQGLRVQPCDDAGALGAGAGGCARHPGGLALACPDAAGTRRAHFDVLRELRAQRRQVSPISTNTSRSCSR